MPPVKLDSFLTADVINGRTQTVETADEDALADVWGQTESCVCLITGSDPLG